MREQRQVRLNSKLSEEFHSRLWTHQGPVLAPFPYAVVVDLARAGELSE